MWASELLFGRGALLRFRSADWAALGAELGRRAGGRRESGAFLLTPREAGRTVTRVVYFDDLDPTALNGGVQLRAGAFSRLWDLCDREGVRAAGDIHTHPGSLVGQSVIDRANPLVARAGHVALIAPNLAARPFGPADVGVHLYRGDAGWTSWTGREAATHIYVGRWA